MTLLEFVTARLTEDENVAKAALGEYGAQGTGWSFSEENGEIDFGIPNEHFNIEPLGAFVNQATHMVRHEPRRVLADVAAKRSLLARHDRIGTRWVGLPRADREERYCMGCDEAFPCETVRLLALPYSQHPGYRQSWRPL